MRILLSVPWFLPERGGGGQTYVLHVAKELRNRGHEVQVLTGMRWDGGEVRFRLVPYTYDDLIALGLQINPSAKRWEDDFTELCPTLLEGLSAALEETRPDIVHLNGLKPGLTRLCTERGIPFVVSAHHPGAVCPAGLRLNEKGELCKMMAEPRVCVPCCSRQRAQSRLLGALLSALPVAFTRSMAKGTHLPSLAGYAARGLAFPGAIRDSLQAKALVWEKAPLWIAPSLAMRKYLLLQSVHPSRVVHVPHGMNPVTGVPRALPDPDTVRFGYLGGFSFPKGLHVLIEAVSQLSLKERGELHLFGKATTPWDQAYLEETMDRYTGSVKIVLHDPVPRERIAEAYAAFDVLVVPSILLEVFGLVVLEAFSARRPVIVSKSGGPAELVRHGINGFVVERNDSEALAKAMQKVINDPGLISKMAMQIPPIKTMSEYVDEMEEVYRSILTGNT